MVKMAKSIQINLLDGDAEGRTVINLSNWNGVVYKIPRTYFSSCSDLDYIRQPGVYFLFGVDESLNKKFVYIGEGEDVFKRIRDAHDFDCGSTKWSNAIVIVTSNCDLDKAKIKYLEHKFILATDKANRFVLENKVYPAEPYLHSSAIYALKEFILNTEMIFRVTGVDIFIPEARKKILSEEEQRLSEGEYEFMLTKTLDNTCSATLRSDGNNLWLLSGAKLNPEVKWYVEESVNSLRREWAGYIDNWKLTRDIPVSSPTAAANFVNGRSNPGPQVWTTRCGEIPYGDIFGNDAFVKKRKVLEKVDESQVLFLKGNNAYARGIIVEDGFVVFRGSKVSISMAKSCGEGYKKLRNELVETGIITNLEFKSDYKFASMNEAACTIYGSPVSGVKIWKYADGVSYKNR